MNATFSHDNDISLYKKISQILSALPLDFFVLSSSNSPEFTLCCLVLAHIGTRKVARYQQKIFFLKCHSCINIYMYLFYLTSPCTLYVNEKEKIHSMCLINDGIEDTEYFLLSCHFYDAQRHDLLGTVSAILLSEGL